MAYTQQLNKLNKLDNKTYELINNIIKTVSETDEKYEEFWNKISTTPFETSKTSKKPRAKSGYYVFSSNQDIRNKIKTENPDNAKNIGFISKQISELWKNLSEEEKNLYKNQAKEINEKSEQEFSNQNNQVVKKKKSKKSAYNCFIGNKTLRQDIQENSSEKLSMLQINKILSEKWKNISEDEKNVYLKEAEDYNNKQNSIINEETNQNTEETKQTEESNNKEKKEVKKVKKKNVIKK